LWPLGGTTACFVCPCGEKIIHAACLTAVVVLQLVPRAEPLAISIANGFGLSMCLGLAIALLVRILGTACLLRFGAATNSRVIGSGVDMQALATMVLVRREVNGPLGLRRTSILHHITKYLGL